MKRTLVCGPDKPDLREPATLTTTDNLQDLYNRFDGEPNGNVRLAWYGQMRAKGLSHEKAVTDTYHKFKWWCDEVWPIRGIPLP